MKCVLLKPVRFVKYIFLGYEIIHEIPCPKLPYNETGTAYIILKFPEEDLPNTIGSFGAVLKFIVKDCDPATGLPDIDEGFLSSFNSELLKCTDIFFYQVTTMNIV